MYISTQQIEMKERLLSAYFVEGRHIGRIHDLGELAAEVGLDREGAIRALESEEYLADVRADQRQAMAYGISDHSPSLSSAASTESPAPSSPRCSSGRWPG